MGKIEHNEALENEAAMHQHAQNLLQLSQEPLLHQKPTVKQPEKLLDKRHHEQELHQRLLLQQHHQLQQMKATKDATTVGYFMEVSDSSPTRSPANGIDVKTDHEGVDDRLLLPIYGRIGQVQNHQNEILQVSQQYNQALLQSRILPKDEPMSPRSLASSPLASGSASPQSPLSNGVAANEISQRLAAKGLLQQPQLSHLHPQQVVISPAETLVISTSAFDPDNIIVSAANSPTSTVAVTTSPDIPQTKIPGTTVYEGECGFRISFAPQMKETKSAQWTYSGMLHKLFTRINAACPIRFQCAYKLPPSGTILRALPIYMQPEHVCEAVVRCPVHAATPPEIDQVHTTAGRSTSHLIRADHPHAEYVEADPQYGRQSVCVPFEAPAVGTQWSTVLYRFMCNSSCAGGMNRRPIQTVFTLETPSGEVIGRQVVEVRICACPGRDSKVEERNVMNKGGGNNEINGLKANGVATPKVEPSTNGFGLDLGAAGSPAGPDSTFGHSGRRRKRPYQHEASTTHHVHYGSHHDDDETPNSQGIDDQRVFTLLVRGRDTFELLKRIRDSIELSKMASPDQIDRLQAMESEMEQQVNAASSLISFMSQPPEVLPTSNQVLALPPPPHHDDLN